MLTPAQISVLYDEKLARRYDRHISHMLGELRARAYRDTALQAGDRVIVFCCGTGLDFACILARIGSSGRIVGVDSSAAMLARARARVTSEGWANVELLEADVTQLEGRFAQSFDAGVCTLGLSIIPDYEVAYRELQACVRPGGEILIGDAQLAEGWRSFVNPVVVLFGRRFGASYEGHRNTLALRRLMERELVDVRTREGMLGGYFHCVGRVP